MTGTSPVFAGSLGFLLSQVGAEAAYRFGDALADLGVTPRAYAVLATVEAGGEHTQQQLADLLGIHRNNMVGLIDEMSAAGWVRRTRSATDRRAFLIMVTPAGHRLAARVDALGPGLNDDLAAGLSRQDRAALTALLVRLADSLDLTRGVHPHLGRRRG